MPSQVWPLDWGCTCQGKAQAGPRESPEILQDPGGGVGGVQVEPCLWCMIEGQLPSWLQSSGTLEIVDGGISEQERA